MPATDGGETPIPRRGSTSCELRAATLHLGSAHPPALFCTLVPPFRKCVRTVPQVRPHSAAVHPSVPEVRPRRSVGSSPLFRTLRPTVPHSAFHCSAGSSPLFRTERPTVPYFRPHCSAWHVSLFLRFVPTVPHSASPCSAGSSPLFRTVRPTVPHVRNTVPHQRPHRSARASDRSARASPRFGSCVICFCCGHLRRVHGSGKYQLGTWPGLCRRVA